MSERLDIVLYIYFFQKLAAENRLRLDELLANKWLELCWVVNLSPDIVDT